MDQHDALLCPDNQHTCASGAVSVRTAPSCERVCPTRCPAWHARPSTATQPVSMAATCAVAPAMPALVADWARLCCAQRVVAGQRTRREQRRRQLQRRLRARRQPRARSRGRRRRGGRAGARRRGRRAGRRRRRRRRRLRRCRRGRARRPPARQWLGRRGAAAPARRRQRPRRRRHRQARRFLGRAVRTPGAATWPVAVTRQQAGPVYPAQGECAAFAAGAWSAAAEAPMQAPAVCWGIVQYKGQPGRVRTHAQCLFIERDCRDSW